MLTLPSSWLWFFPLTYLVHILEEAFAGEGFYRWILHLTRRTLSRHDFFKLNGLFLAIMIMTVAFSSAEILPLWSLSALATITVLNRPGHLLETIASCSYSPGLISGLLLWFSFRTSRPHLEVGGNWHGSLADRHRCRHFNQHWGRPDWVGGKS